MIKQRTKLIQRQKSNSNATTLYIYCEKNCLEPRKISSQQSHTYKNNIQILFVTLLLSDARLKEIFLFVLKVT